MLPHKKETNLSALIHEIYFAPAEVNAFLQEKHLHVLIQKYDKIIQHCIAS